MKAAKQPGTEGRRQCDSAHARRPEQADPETGGQARGGSGWGQGVASGLALSFAQGPPEPHLSLGDTHVDEGDDVAPPPPPRSTSSIVCTKAKRDSEK